MLRFGRSGSRGPVFDEAHDAAPRNRGRLRWLLLACAAGLGLAVRLACWGDTFADGRVYFYGNDSWYHMRRVVFALDHGFRLPDFGRIDPYLNYPEGGQGYWGPLFDWGVASLLSAAGPETRIGQETWAAFVPAVLGAMCVLPAFLIASLFWERGIPVLAAFFLALLPGHVLFSQLGNFDHHVLESFLFGLVLYQVLGIVRRTRRSRPAVVLAALSIVALYLVTPITSNVCMAVVWASTLAAVFFDPAPGASRAAQTFLTSAGLLLVLAVVFVGGPTSGVRPWGNVPAWLMFERYSLFQPLGLAFAGLSIWAAGRARVRDIPTWHTWRFRVALLTSAAILIVFAVPLLAGLDVLWRGDPDMRYTEEALPLLRHPGRAGIHFGVALDDFSYGFVLFPLFLLYVFFKEPGRRVVVVMGALLLLLVLTQIRFAHVFSYAMALALAWATDKGFRDRRLWPGSALVLVVLFWPCLSWIDAFANHQKYASVSKSVYDMCLWMKSETPATRGFRDADTPEYSVLASWDMGNALIYLAERAVVADPFNHGFEASGRYFTATDPDEAVSILEEKRARYVIPVSLTHPYLQEVFLAYARRTGDHPLRRGEWSSVFSMQLLRGQASDPRGHRPVYRSPDGTVVVFEHDLR